MAIYYVKNGGSDSADGLSDANAWASIAKVSSFALSPGFSPGDIIKFKCGHSFQTPIAGGGADNSLFPNSGTSAGVITITSYGTGAKPILHSSVTANTTGDWHLISGNLWYCNDAAFIKDVGNIIFGGGTSVGVKVATSAECTAQGYYWYDTVNNDRVRMYSVGNPATYYSGDIRCCYQVDVIWLHYTEYITIDGLNISYGGSHGIGGFGCSHIQIRNCNFTWLGGCSLDGVLRYGNGVELLNADGYSSDDVLIEYNYFNEIYDTGFSFQGGYGGSNGPDWSNITVRYNVLSNIEWMFEFWTTGSDVTVTNVYIQNNTCVDAGGQKLHASRWAYTYANHFYWGPMEGTFTNVYLRNNIFSNANGINNYPPLSSMVAIIIERYADRLKINIDYNLYRISSDVNDWAYLGYINSGERLTLADWRTASGKDANSLQADPLFTNRANGDFTLQIGSPAINKGISTGYTRDFVGNPIVGNPDVGAYEYVAGGGSTYDGVLQIWDGNNWVPKPLAVQNGGMLARPVRMYVGGQWKLVQSF